MVYIKGWGIGDWELRYNDEIVFFRVRGFCLEFGRGSLSLLEKRVGKD